MPNRERTWIPVSLLAITLSASAAAIAENQYVIADRDIITISVADNVPAPAQARSADSDSDGIFDDQDNCTEVANPAQRDTDSDNIGNLCDADIAAPNDCSVNFPDLHVMKLAFFSNPGEPNWNADADLNGDDAVNFADLLTVNASFFGQPGPSGLANVCTSLSEGDVCDPGANLCGPGLSCCYPCGIPDCDFICEVTCDPDNPACADGCFFRP